MVNRSSTSTPSSSSSDDTDDNKEEDQEDYSDNDKDIIFENETFVTCRSPTDSFYLGQVLQDVTSDTKKIRIRWCSVVGGNDDTVKIGVNTRFKLDYIDKLDPDTILMSIPNIIYHDDDTISLKKEDIVDTKRLLLKSIRGESLSSDDMMDLSTEAHHKKKTSSHIFFQSSSDSDTNSSSSQSSALYSPTTKKRKLRPKKSRSRKQPAKKRARRTPGSSDNATGKLLELFGNLIWT